jgi:hypothetical protein
VSDSQCHDATPLQKKEEKIFLLPIPSPKGTFKTVKIHHSYNLLFQYMPGTCTHVSMSLTLTHLRNLKN